MTTTALVCTIAIICLGIYDLIMVETGGVNRSISRWLQWCRKWPFIVFVFGYIAGHVFGFMNQDCPQLERKDDDSPRSQQISGDP